MSYIKKIFHLDYLMCFARMHVMPHVEKFVVRCYNKNKLEH